MGENEEKNWRDCKTDVYIHLSSWNWHRRLNILGGVILEKLMRKAPMKTEIKKYLKDLCSCLAFVCKTWGQAPKRCLWFCKWVILFISHFMWMLYKTCLSKTEVGHLQRAVCGMITRTTGEAPTKTSEMCLNLLLLETVINGTFRNFEKNLWISFEKI